MRALARWPNVPAVYGWLSLNARGQWLIKGETIGNPLAVGFINRNYLSDESGRWYFQNGPQRVFVQLYATPWIYRLGLEGAHVHTHTEQAVREIVACYMDDAGAVLLESSEGIGYVDDRDLELLSRDFYGRLGERLSHEVLAQRIDALMSGQSAELSVRFGEQQLPISYLAKASLAKRFAFVVNPQAEDEQAD